jgi:hypothetical protein
MGKQALNVALSIAPTPWRSVPSPGVSNRIRSAESSVSVGARRLCQGRRSLLGGSITNALPLAGGSVYDAGQVDVSGCLFQLSRPGRVTRST